MTTREIKNRITNHDEIRAYWYPDALPECTPADITTPHEREEIGGGDIEKGTEIVWGVINKSGGRG